MITSAVISKFNNDASWDRQLCQPLLLLLICQAKETGTKLLKLFYLTETLGFFFLLHHFFHLWSLGENTHTGKKNTYICSTNILSVKEDNTAFTFLLVLLVTPFRLQYFSEKEPAQKGTSTASWRVINLYSLWICKVA